MAKFPVSLAILLGLLPLVKGLPGNVCMFTDTGSKHQGKLQAIADAACNQWPDAHKWLENLAYGLRNNKWELEEAGANNVMCGAWGDMAWKHGRGTYAFRYHPGDSTVYCMMQYPDMPCCYCKGPHCYKIP